jgi:hypothetical protein
MFDNSIRCEKPAPRSTDKVYVACVLDRGSARDLALLLERMRVCKGGLTIDAPEVVSVRSALKTLGNALERAEALP